jgi:hypothetical protein
MSQKALLFGAAATLAVAIACGGGEKGNPVSPSASPAGQADAGAEGETLKVTAPTPTAPANGSRLDTFTPVLTVTASTAKYQTGVALAHRFQLLNGSTVVAEFRTAGTTWTVNASLNENATYGWRVRGEQGAAFGPWSPTWTFTTPEQPKGYVRGNEVYDPLVNGTTVGQVHGPVTFIPGQGVRLDSFESYITYQLSEPLTQGEYSLLATGLDENNDGNKTKLFSMWNGDYNDPVAGCGLTCNSYRMSVELRGDDFGQGGSVAWRFITGDDSREVDTEGSERRKVTFTRAATYLWQATWRGRFDLRIFEGGAGGREIYSFGKNYSGTYRPTPHIVVVGSAPSRSGPGDSSVPGAVIRQVWVSGSPRPSFANK